MTLAIGDASQSNKAIDSLASSSAAGALTKMGAGTLILNADNAYWQNAVNVNGGSLLLGNAGARLGGSITVADGATFGGVGTIATLSQSDGALNAKITAQAGSILQIGNGGPADRLSLSGTLVMEGGVTLDYGNYSGALLEMSHFELLGSGTITLSANAGGIFTLASWTTGTLDDSATFALINNATPGPRTGSVSTILETNALKLDVSVANSSSLAWTGGGGSLWQLGGAQLNWTGTTTGGAVQDYQNGDIVFFDATASNRDISIETASVNVAGMTVSGNADYSFDGGGITSTGTLVKSGAGRLSFNNTGGNSFGTISLRQGELIISRADQLGNLGSIDSGAGASTFGGEGAARILIKGDAIFDGTAGSQHIGANDTTIRDVGFLVADGKLLTIRNSDSGSADGGFFGVGDNTALVMGPEVANGTGRILFENNSSSSATVGKGGGVMFVSGTAKITNATFLGNQAVHGGAFSTGNASAVLTLDNPVFINNTADASGGAIYNYDGVVNINISNTGVTTYEGNTAAGAADGGFLYQSSANATVNLDIANDATVIIGSAADVAKDSLASASASSKFNKTGFGALVLHGDSSAYSGITTLGAGSMFLGNASAKLGGTVNAAAGVLVGGLGAYTGVLSLATGGTLQIGIDSNVPSILAINDFKLDGGVLLFDLFDSGTTDKLDITNLSSIGGSHTIDVSSYKNGDHIIATIATGDINTLKNNATVTIGGRTQAGARQTMVLEVSGIDLILSGTSDMSRSMAWTGAGSVNTAWDTANENWTDGGSITTFAEGDRVTFDATSPAATHAIDIAGSRITVSDMIVDGNADYAFTGAGITTDANSVVAGVLTGATGKLTKDGAGTLTLANTTANDFKGGIEFKAGVIALASAGASGTGGINIAGANTTLRMAAADLVLTNSIALNANTLQVDTQAGNATLAGIISGAGGITKIGGGTLALNAANTFTGVTTLSAGALALGNNTALGAASAKLAINNNDATIILSAADLNIVNDADLGAAANTLTVDTLANTGTLAGVISGAGALAKTGAGTLALTGSNTFGGNLAINEGVVSVNSSHALGLGKLAGAGTLDVATGGAFAFASGAAGGGFTGIVAVNSGGFTLDSNAAAVLAAPTATLRVDAGAVAEKASGNQTIGGLALNGGRVNLAMNGITPDGLLTVGDLDIGAGSQVGVDTAQLLADQANPAVPPAPNLLDQDGATTIKLIAATNVTGGNSVALTGADGAAIVPPSLANIKQGADTVAQASYAYAATVISDGSGAGNGIYMGYGLSEIEILADKILNLDGTTSADKTLSARLAGTGGLGISGAVILANSGNTYSGTTTINAGGTLKGGVVNAFAQSAAVDVKAGATLDLGGFAQTAQNLTGAGFVSLGAVALTAQNTADSVFAGNISGTGKLIKIGADKLSLTGANDFGGLDIAAGAVGVGNAAALGNGAIAATGTGAKVVAEIDNLVIVNTINLGTNGLIVDTAANNTTLGGIITGDGALTLQGAGVATLSGANTFGGGLRANAARVVVTRTDAIGTGVVSIGSTSILEFRGIASGTVTNALTGGAVALDNSTLYFKGSNALLKLDVGGGSRLTAGSVAALGAGNSTVTVASNGEIIFETPNTIAKNMVVDTGGKLTFNNSGTVPMLYVSGTVSLAGSSTIALGTIVSGNTVLMRSIGGVVNNGVIFDPGANTELLDWNIASDGGISVAVIQRAANPGKDIAATYDAMSAATGAVYTRLSESFLMNLVGEQSGGPANSAWIKGVGTFGNYNADAGRIGYTSDARGVMAGYDRKVSDKLFAGGYIGYLSSKLSTDRSDTDITYPYAGAYGAIRQGGAYLAADIMFGMADADTTRYEYTGYASGSYKASTIAGSLELGTVLGVWDRGAIKPAVALHYMDYSHRDHKESGVGSVNIDNLDDSRLESLLGVQISQGFDMPWNRSATFDMRMGWRAALKDAPLDVSGEFTADGERFTIQGDIYNRNSLMLGLGLRCSMTDKSDFALAYDYEMGRDFDRHNISATIRFTW
ncbi:MAG: autotransporter-associated beta strand repeat-containing protein [Opitutaceae bacterium]|nr:autotransporter-associated beta strand repeat-containing protein [Opitutaceae bacterium]